MAPKCAVMFGLVWLVADGCGSSPNGDGQHGAGGGKGGSRAAGGAAPNDPVDAGAVGGASKAMGGGTALGGQPGGAGGSPLGPGGGGGTPGGLGLGGAGGGRAGAAGNPPGSGGIGGQGGSDPGQALLLPPGCEPRARAATDGSCMLSAFCGALSYVTNCRRLDSGRWQCSSEPHYADRVYEIDGVAGLQACAVATGLSSMDQLRLGEDSCLPLTDAVGADYCATSVVCGPTIEVDFAPNARARLARYGSVECAPISLPDTINCNFHFDETSARPNLSTYSDSLSCRPVLEFCMSTSGPTFAGPRSCVATQAISAADGCQRSELCSSPLPSTEAPGFPTIEARYASCEPDGGGGASCYCSAGADTIFMFQVASAPDDAACAAAVTSCEPTAHIDATGDATCKPTSQSTTSNACEADLTCAQAATVDGRAVVAAGRLLVRCARAQQGKPWSCGCASDQLTATFSLGAAGATPAQACAQAPQACVTHIPVHLGPYRSVVSPPDPPL